MGVKIEMAPFDDLKWVMKVDGKILLNGKTGEPEYFRLSHVNEHRLRPLDSYLYRIAQSITDLS